MARHFFGGSARDSSTGQIRPSSTITIYLAGTLTLASVYAASTGGVAVSSVLSDSDGKFGFWVDEADYALTQLFDLVSSKTGFTSITYQNVPAFNLTAVDTDGTMAANSDKKIPTQKAVVTYVSTNYQPLASNLTTLAGLASVANLSTLAGLASVANLSTVAGYASLANLGALVGLTGAADYVPYFTGAGTMSTTSLTSFARSLLDDTDAATARATLGVSAAADVSKLTSYYQPCLQDGMYGAFKAGWQPFWFNQQWGGAPWMDNLVDGATGEAYTFQAATGILNQAAGNSFFGYDNTYYYLSQGFKVSKATTLSALWVKVFKVANPTANLQLSIYSDNAGSPDSAIANGGATAIAGTLITSNTNGSWYRFVFATPPSLSANTLYHIVLSSSSNSTTSYFNCKQSTAVYPHGGVSKIGSNVPAWSTESGFYQFQFMVEPVTNMLTSGGQFDGKLTFSEGSPLNQSEAMAQPLKNFFDYKEGTISIVGASWTKDKTIWDAQYGLDHDRIVLRCNATTGYAQVDLYEKDGTKHTVTGTTDISDATVRRLTIAYRAKNDGSDFLKLYVNATSEGTPITGASINFDPLMKELGNISLGGGFALAPTWTNDYTCTALPTAATPAWTYDGTNTEAAHAAVSGGKLFLQIVGATDVCGWHIHPTFVNANGWSVIKKFSVQKASDVTGEIEAETGFVDDAKVITVAYHTYFLEVSYDHTATFTTKIQLDMRKEHVFHAWGKGSDFFLSCDGKLIVDGTGLMTHAEAGGAGLSFGDYDATSGSNAESIWDYIKYYETASLPPQFTAGSLSEFSYFSGDQTGLLAALYNSGTLKSVKELCGVGRNYIDVGEREMWLRGITSTPTTAATSPVLLTDMEAFAYGADVDVEFSSIVSNGSTDSAYLFPYVDGVNKLMAMHSSATANYKDTPRVKVLEKLNFSLHKVDGKWDVSAGTGTANGKERMLYVRAK